jgi:hypothetical protein
MRLEGRSERRVVKAVPIYLVTAAELVAEHAVAVNVSPHGARLRTKRKWKPGERPRVAMKSSELRVEAKVVYCEPLPDGGFCTGLEIRPGVMDWEDGTGRKPEVVAERKAWSRFFAGSQFFAAVAARRDCISRAVCGTMPNSRLMCMELSLSDGLF